MDALPATTDGLATGPGAARLDPYSPVLGDRFVLLEPLGEGGHAIVWRARDRLGLRRMVVAGPHRVAPCAGNTRETGRCQTDWLPFARPVVEVWERGP